jgi:hypothetical protein
MPFSPCSGSSTTAATVSSTTAARASASPYGTKVTSPGSGSKGARYFGLWVMASAPIERPWKAPSVEMIRVRPVIRVSLKAASLASVPELVKNTRASSAPSGSTIAASRWASATWAGVAKKFETCPRVAIWPVTADSTVGCAWPSALTAIPASRSRWRRPSASQT